MVVALKSRTDRENLESLKPQVLEELNVKDIELVDDAAVLERPGYTIMTEGDLAIAVCTEISPELAAEGMAREIVHRLQTMRKSAGFEIADYIVTYYTGDDYIQKVMRDFSDYIKQETLSRQLVPGEPEKGAFAESVKLGGHTLHLGVKKAYCDPA